MQRTLIVTVVAGQIISPFFKGRAVPWPLKLGPIGHSETSVTNYQYTLRIIPEKQLSDFPLLWNVVTESRTQEASTATCIWQFPPSSKSIDLTTHLDLQPRPGSVKLYPPSRICYAACTGQLYIQLIFSRKWIVFGFIRSHRHTRRLLYVVRPNVNIAL